MNSTYKIGNIDFVDYIEINTSSYYNIKEGPEDVPLGTQRYSLFTHTFRGCRHRVRTHSLPTEILNIIHEFLHIMH